LWAKPAVFYTINTDVWNGLSEEIQGQIKEAIEATYGRYSELYAEDWNTCVRETKEMGCTVNSLSKEDMNRWTSMPVVDEIQAQWVKEMEEQGFKEAKEILEQIKRVVVDVVEKEE